ncbi:secretion protein HlyD [Verrucomicrobiota bacterium]|nr:secretion protein HlyD [Verrucomicrobiota bacterium]
MNRFPACLLLASTLATLAASAADIPTVRVVTPTRGEIHRFVSLPGVVRPWQQATLFARVPGYLKTIAVDRGDEVAAGAVLAEIDAPELLADVARAKAEVLQATAGLAKATADVESAKATAARYRAEVPRAKAELDIAGLEFERTKRAQEKAPDLVVQQSVDTARARLEMANATQAATQATVDAAAAAAQAAAAGREVAAAMLEVATTGVARTEAMAGFTKIVAPFAGTITARRFDPGAFISLATGGNASAQNALLTLMDYRTVRLQVTVPESEAALVTKGQPVKATFDGLPGRPPFEGVVSRLAGVLEEASKTMLVEADLPNPNRELRPGMYASVRVGVERHTDVLLVPVEAVVMEKTAAFVFTVAGGKAVRSAVKIGYNDGKNVEIVSGLAAGQGVILVGKLALANGQAVSVGEGK